MARVAPSRTKINTEVTQLASRQPSRRSPGPVQPGRPARRAARVGGDARGSVRDPGRRVVELDCGITVYPPEMEGEPWRAVFTENGKRRYRQAATEARLAAKLEKVRERLEADAPNPRLKGVHWQATGRILPVPKVSTAGESALWVYPSGIPSAGDVERLGQALAAGRHGDQDELMAHVAAYSGLRWARSSLSPWLRSIPPRG